MDTKLYVFLFAVTLVQIWWIAVWGITDIIIRILAGKHRHIEFLIYVFFIAGGKNLTYDYYLQDLALEFLHTVYEMR